MQEPLMDTPLGNVAEMQIRKSSGMVHDHLNSEHSWAWQLSWVAAFWVANVLLEKAAHALHISFPSSLLGMFFILACLVGLEQLMSANAADSALRHAMPALAWVQDWMPLFYAPLLVTLPLALKNVSRNDLARTALVVAVGMPATLLVTAHCVLGIRHLTGKEMQPQPQQPPASPFTRAHALGWGAMGSAALLLGLLVPQHWQHFVDGALLLAATVCGFLAGSAMPAAIQRLLHPIITCAISTNAAAYMLGVLRGTGYYEQLQRYCCNKDGMKGGGDVILSFLGVVILSFGFSVFQQRKLMLRHAPEVFGGVLISALFSLFGTAAASHLVGLAPALALSLVPRSITAALAVPIASALGADTSFTAAAVVLTGVLGANISKVLLDWSAVKDPIARGMSTAASSHGIGTAALVASEPDALPFCALAYALVGITSTILMSVPLLRSAIIAITGQS